MMWAVSSGPRARDTYAAVGQIYGRIFRRGDIKQLHVLMNNWTDGVADKTRSNEVHNGFGAWRVPPPIATMNRIKAAAFDAGV